MSDTFAERFPLPRNARRFFVEIASLSGAWNGFRSSARSENAKSRHFEAPSRRVRSFHTAKTLSRRSGCLLFQFEMTSGTSR